MAEPVAGQVMDHDRHLLGVASLLRDTPAAGGMPVEAEARARKADRNDREKHALSAPSKPISRRDEHRTLADATVARAPHRSWSPPTHNGPYVPVDVTIAHLSAIICVR